MKSISLSLCLLVLCCVLPACAADTAKAPETEDEKTLYAIGLAMAQGLSSFNLTEEELALVQQGLADSLLGNETSVDLGEYGPKIQVFAQARLDAAAEAEKTAATAFLEQEAGKEGTTKTESGLLIQEITAGTGASPSATDQVTVHYTGTLRDGTEFDSSVTRGTPATFALNGVIPCWTEAVQTMAVGGKIRVVCPSDQAYGPQGRPPTIPGNAALVFEIELLDVVTPPETPPAAAAPPADGGS